MQLASYCALLHDITFMCMLLTMSVAGRVAARHRVMVESAPPTEKGIYTVATPFHDNVWVFNILDFEGGKKCVNFKVASLSIWLGSKLLR